MYRFKIYRDRVGEYRWRLRARNGAIVAVSGEGYTSAWEALAAARRVRAHAGGATVQVLRPGRSRRRVRRKV